jgi:hypothetical protein
VRHWRDHDEHRLVDLGVVFVKLVKRRWFVIERLRITRDCVNGHASTHYSLHRRNALLSSEMTCTESAGKGLSGTLCVHGVTSTALGRGLEKITHDDEHC